MNWNNNGVFTLANAYLMPYLDVVGRGAPGLSSPRSSTGISFLTGVTVGLGISSGVPECNEYNKQKFKSNCALINFSIFKRLIYVLEK